MWRRRTINYSIKLSTKYRIIENQNSSSQQNVHQIVYVEPQTIMYIDETTVQHTAAATNGYCYGWQYEQKSPNHKTPSNKELMCLMMNEMKVCVTREPS